MTRALLIIVALLLAACGGEPVAEPTPEPVPAATPSPEPSPSFDHAAARAECEAQGQRYHRPSQSCFGSTRTPAPDVSRSTLDPDTAFELWQEIFGGGFDDDFGIALAEAFESDFYWIESVDRATYDPDAHAIRFDISVGFESVYLRRPEEWRSDTWTFYRSFARDVIGVFVESEGEGFFAEIADWPRWTPDVALNANAGRLTADCPGGLIYDIQQRQATQAEFESECSFSH